MFIEIDGKKKNIRETLLASLLFKRETGHDVTEIKGVSDMAVYLWCVVKASMKADGDNFDTSLEDFLASIDPSALTAWAESQGAAKEGEKKRPRK